MNDTRLEQTMPKIMETKNLISRHFTKDDIGKTVFIVNGNRHKLEEGVQKRYKNTILVMYKTELGRVDKTNRDTFIEIAFKRDSIELRTSKSLSVWMATAGYKSDEYRTDWDLKYLYHFDRDDIDSAVVAANTLMSKYEKEYEHAETHHTVPRRTRETKGESPSSSSEIKALREKEATEIEEQIDSLNLEGLDKEAVIKVRVNQGKFREIMLKKYDRCCLCNVRESALLMASHIKPWSDSAPDERLDEDNGFLLCPNHDKLFDGGWISFDDDGKILISDKLDVNNCTNMNVRSDMKIQLSEGNRKYLAYHRDKVFR